MDKIKENLIKLKDELYELHMDKNDDDFIKLVKLHDINDELYETLILIHSNCKDEMQAVKNGQIRMLTKMIDYDIELLTKYKEMLHEIKEQKHKTPLINPKNLAIVLFTIACFIIVIWYLFTLNQDAAKWSGELLKSIFTLNFS